MTMAGGEGEEERISLPVRLEGSYLMEIQVESVFPEGGAELALRYRDFDLTTVSTVRDREMTVLLSDRGLMISEGDRVLKKTEPGEDGFPLRGVIGEKFEFRVDNRGTIIDARVPPAPDSLFSALDFTSFLERMQPEFPREPVPAGASWSRTIEVPGPGLGRPWDRGERWSVQFDSTFRDLTGSGGQVARIDFAGDFRQAPPAPEAEDRSGMRGSSHNLSGTYEFDRAAGRVLASRSILRQVLDSRIDLDQVLRGRKIDIRVNDTLEVAVRLRQ